MPEASDKKRPEESPIEQPVPPGNPELTAAVRSAFAKIIPWIAAAELAAVAFGGGYLKGEKDTMSNLLPGMEAQAGVLPENADAFVAIKRQISMADAARFQADAALVQQKNAYNTMTDAFNQEASLNKTILPQLQSCLTGLAGQRAQSASLAAANDSLLKRAGSLDATLDGTILALSCALPTMIAAEYGEASSPITRAVMRVAAIGCSKFTDKEGPFMGDAILHRSTLADVGHGLAMSSTYDPGVTDPDIVFPPSPDSARPVAEPSLEMP